MALFRSVGTTLEMIKWEHSVLTLPFGLTGAVLAARGIPTLRTLDWIMRRAGGGAFGGHGVQPAGGRDYRRGQPSHRDAPCLPAS